MNHISIFRNATVVILFILISWVANAQPTVMSLNQDVSGTYANTTMTLVGAAFKLRVQEDAVGTSSGTRNWQFNSDSYGNTWGARSANTLTSYNAVIAPNITTASGNWANACSPGCYNAFGKLPATLPNNYYTYTIMRGTSYASQRMSVLETSYNPVTIDAVAQAAGTFGSRTITITTSGTPDAAENIFVRYSTNSYVASTIVQATGSGTTWTATIPAQSAAVSFYVYSSNRSKAAIDADVTSFSTQEVHDLSTLNLNNNAGSNYSYFPVNVTSTGGTTSATYATLAAAIAAINGGTHTGTIVCTVNDGYTETAPPGGFILTTYISNTSATPVVFQRSNTGGAKPIFNAGVGTSTNNDAIFKLIGNDFITIDGFDLRESAGNITSTTQVEWGIALLYTTTTNGAQNNTIQNCNITLNRTYANTFGIYSNVRHSSTSATTQSDITTAAGSNSGNKIYGNTISNVNMGITFIGCGATGGTALQDQGNDIGGSSAATGNTITNWGGLSAIASYVSNSGSIYGILLNHQQGVNCSYNTLTSASFSSNIGSRGIFLVYTALVPNAGTFTNTISNNTITITNSTSSTFEMIRSEGMTTALSGVTINLNNNSLINCSTPGNFVGVINTSAPGTLNMNGNIVRGIVLSGSGSGFTGVSNTGAVVTSINQNDNQIGNATGGAVTYSVTSSGTFFGVSNTGGASTAALTITGNDVRGITYSTSGSGAHTYINNTAATLSQNISSNTFTALDVNTTSNVTFISNNVALPTGGSLTASSNSLAGTIPSTALSFRKSGAGGTVTLYLTTNAPSSVTTTTKTAQNNNFSNISITGATTMNGWMDIEGAAAGLTKTITGNTFSNWTCGSSAVTALQVGYCLGTSAISSNTISNITGSGAITGISLLSNNVVIAGVNTNTLSGLASTGTGGAVTGISSASPTVTFNSNTISSLSSSSTTATVAGISSSGATSTISNNTVNTLSCVGSASGVTNGIMVTAGTTINVFKNKIYDIATTGAFSASPGVNGIVLSGAVASVTATVHNNLIGDLRAAAANSTDAIRGISVTATGTTSTYNVYYNTVHLAATSSGTNFGTSGIFHTASATATTAALNLRNNIIVNNSTASGTGIVTAFRRSAASTLGNYASTSNNNLFSSASGSIMHDGTTAFTLTTFKTAVGPTRDAASVTEVVSNTPGTFFQSFTGSSAGFLHIVNALSTQAESGAATISGFLDDFDGDTRNATTPDIGADEFNGVLADLNPPVIAYTPLGNGLISTDQTLTATITDLSGVPTSGAGLPVLYYRVNAGSYIAVTGTSIGSNQYTFTFGAAATMGGDVVSYYIVAQDLVGTPNVTSFPLAGAGGFTSNPPAAATPPTTPSSFMALAGLSGIKTVCASGCDYTSLTNAGGAFATINGSVVSGNIILQITGDLTSESGTNALNAFASPFTLTINPTAAVNVVSTASAANLINFNGADRVTIDGLNSSGNSLTFDNPFTGGTTFALTNDATNNTIQNCTIKGGNTSVTSGVVVFGTGTTTGNDGNTFANNAITASGTNFPANIIYSAGTSAAIDNSGNTLNNNTISDYFSATLITAGVNLSATGNSAWTITNNKLFQTATRIYTSGNTHNGIFVGTGAGYTITGNTIGFANASGTGTTNMVGNSVALTGTFPSSYTTTGTSNGTRYIGLNCAFTVGGTVSSIQNNTIGGFALYTSSGSTTTNGVWCGINITSGNANVGTSNGNTIGAATGSNAVYVASTTAGAAVVGIYATSTNTVSIQNNTVAAIDAVGTTATLSGAFTGIDVAGTGGVFTISSNTIGNTTANNIRTGYTLTSSNLSNTGTITSTTGSISPIVGIRHTATGSTVTINSNILQGWQNGTTAGGTLTGITSTGAVASGATINNNQLGTTTQGWINYSFANTNSTAATGINSTGTSGTATSHTIQSNDFRGITFSVSGVMAFNFVNLAPIGTATNHAATVSNNTFTNISLNTTGSVTFISHNYSMQSGSSQTISGNSIVTAFAKTAAGGTVTMTTTGASSPNGTTSTVTNNDFSNVTVTGATGITGITNSDGSSSSPAKICTGNTLSNWTTGAGAITAINYSYIGGPTSSISNNTISNITGQSSIAGMNIGNSFNGASTLNIANNILSNFNSSSGFLEGIRCNNVSTVVNINNNEIRTLSTSASTSLIGLVVSGALNTNVFKNKIFDLSSSNVTSSVTGLQVTDVTTTLNVFNNLIGDLRAPAASVTSPTSAITGIGLFTTNIVSTHNIYYNTIYINGTSSGANFGTSGILHTSSATATTGALNLRNNIIVNTSTPNGTGLTVAYRRTGTSLNNYAATSNNNLFFAGTPGASNVIFSDGTNTDQTLAAFKSRVSARETASISENPNWQSIVGSSADFLKFNTATPTGIESGGAAISGYTDDFSGTSRNATTPDLGTWELTGTPLPSCTGTPALSTITGGTTPICSGFSGGTLALSTTYTDLGITYQWKSSTTSGGPYNTILGTVASQVTGMLTQTTYYICEITCTNSSMTFTTDEKAIVVNVLPTVTVSPTSGTYCTPGGTPITLTGDGASTYTWVGTGTPGLSATSGNPVTASPSTNTTITVTGTDGNGCINTATAIIASLATPATPTTTPYSICIGETVPGGQGVTSSVPTVTATQTINFTVSGQPTETNAAPGNVVASATMTALPAGSTVTGITLNYPGLIALSASWRSDIRLGLSGALINAAAQGTGAPGSAGTFDYTRTATSGITGTPLAGGTVNLLYWDNFNDNTGGAEATFPTGAAVASLIVSYSYPDPSSVSWFTTATGGTALGTGTPFNPVGVDPALPNTNTAGDYTYFAQVSNGACPSTRTAAVFTVSSGAAITTNPAAASACVGTNASFTVVATGAGLSYTWELSTDNGGSWNPVVNGGVYSNATTATLNLTGVTGLMNNYQYRVNVTATCGSPVTSTVSILTVTTPLAGINTSATTICAGESATLTENGGTATSWSWAPGGATLQAITVSPATTTTYTVTATVNGCSATAQQIITVNPSPSMVVITPPSASICSGGSVGLTASGGNVGNSGSGTLGTGTSSTVASTTASTLGPNPFQSYYGGAKQQIIVLASELTSLGLTANSSISSIAFNLSAVESRTLQSYVVKMQHTSLSAFTSTSFVMTGFTTVRNAANLTPVSGWNSITLNTPFTWNGTSNLLIEVNFSNNDGGGTGSNTAVFSTTSGFASSLFYRADNQTPAAVDAATTASFAAYTQRNNMQFVFTGTPANFTWSPATGLNTTTGPTVTASPSVTTMYTATSTVNGCTAASSVTVSVTQIAIPTSMGTYTATLNHTDGATLNYIDGSCNLLARIEDASGGNVLGSTTTNLTNSSTAIVANNNVGYVRREYEIAPASNGTSTVTLYFTQADFDDFNATNGTQFDIATGPGDGTGISNIKMVVFTGGNVNVGTRNNLTPSVFWNASESRWEVTATTSLYGYFYIFGDVTCPNVISNITFNNLTATSVIVNWNNASVPEYGIRTRPVGSPVWTNITSSNTNSKTLAGLNPNTTYEIQIRALCSVNERGAYSTSSFTTSALSCSAPSGFVTSNITSNSATLTWNPVAAANSFSIRIKPNSSGTWNNTSSSTNSRVFLGLLANTLYDVEVRTNCTNLGSIYVSYQFTTLASTCTVVSNIVSTSVTSNSANITWDAVASAISYGIRIKPASSGIWNNTSSATNSRNFIGLLANTLYDIEIRSNCNGEASSYVGYQFTTPASMCTVPVNFTTTALSSNSVTITWDAVASAQSYGIRFKPSSSSNWTNNTTSNTNSRTVVGLMPGTSYDFQFRSNCIGEASSFSPTYTIITNTSFNSSDPTTLSGRSSGIGEISSVKIYPNPTAEVLYVSFEAPQAVETTIRVTDITGRVVKEMYYTSTEGYNQTEISFGDLAQGVYMLQVSSVDGWLYTGRVVKTE